jgi:hypothetical protein
VTSQPKDLFEKLALTARDGEAGAFDAALDDLLQRARNEANPDPALQLLVDERLAAELQPPDGSPGLSKAGAGGLTAALGSGARPLAAASSRWLGYTRVLAVLATGVAIGFWWGRSGVSWPAARDRELPAAGTPTVVAGAMALEGAQPGVSSAPALESPAPRTLQPDTPAAPAARAVSSGTPPPARDGRSHSTGAESLRFALEQLRKAQLFLRASEPARALAALDVLDARVPPSVLQEEREVTRALALCDSGDTAKASALAQRVIARSPDSAYAPSLRESCAGRAELLEEMRVRTSNSPR